MTELQAEDRVVVRAKRVRRTVLIVVAAIVIPLIVLRWANVREKIKARLAMQVAYRECMTVTRSPSRVVYDNDPRRKMDLLASDPAYRSLILLEDPKNSAHVTEIVEPFQRLRDLGIDEYGFVAPLFVHGLGDVNLRRLTAVSVGMHPDTDENHVAFTLNTIVVPPINILWPPGMLLEEHRLTFDEARGTPIRFFAGQPDGGDPSRFTIAYEINNRRGAVEGKLLSTTEIRLRVIEGPGEVQYVGKLKEN